MGPDGRKPAKAAMSILGNSADGGTGTASK
jgi:hypothetical protein